MRTNQSIRRLRRLCRVGFMCLIRTVSPVRTMSFIRSVNSVWYSGMVKVHLLNRTVIVGHIFELGRVYNHCLFAFKAPRRHVRLLTGRLWFCDLGKRLSAGWYRLFLSNEPSLVDSGAIRKLVLGHLDETLALRVWNEVPRWENFGLVNG
jgi:hypothetical protein